MEPKPIRRLAEEVVNRVAAGEVIHRPASALKEILENSLDAGATSIVVTVKDGGNKLLQVTDNGCGIREADLPILCERHTTSKLSKFEDLSAMSTFGFRGEALASISFVANLTVTTMTKDATHALKAAYCDGALDGGGARPCAGNPGTTITVENLFYNVATRRKALKSSSEEFSKVLDVIQRYAAMRTDVSFTCRKHGEARPSLHCAIVQNRLDRLQAIYGSQTSRELTPMSLSSAADDEKNTAGAGDDDDPAARFTVDALVSTAGYHSKRSTFVLFINQRLVDCAPLKRACEAVYSAILPKAEKPFVFMSLTLPPHTVDVNVHPTKREVAFLRQDDVVECVQRALERRLIEANGSRTFAVGAVAGTEVDASPPTRMGGRGEGGGPASTTVQSLLPGASRPGGESPGADGGTDPDDMNARNKRAKTTARDKAGGEHKMVRTDARLAAGSLDQFFHTNAEANAERVRLDEARREARSRRYAARGGDVTAGVDDEEAELRGYDVGDSFRGDPEPVPELRDGETTELTSVRELWAEINAASHVALTKVLRGLTLVGCADKGRGLWLLQHGTKLFMVRARRLARDFFHQRVVARFGRHPCRPLAEPAPMAELVRMALDDEDVPEGVEQNGADDKKAKISTAAASLVAEKADMLREYFGVDVDRANKTLVGLPVLCEGHAPDLARLPEFILGLAHDVNWEEEKSCFDTCAKTIACFYAGEDDVSCGDVETGTDENRVPPGEYVARARAEGSAGVQPALGGSIEDVEWVTRHVLFPAVSRRLLPTRASASDGTVLQVACLEQLYRVFERC
jgi:DNA mismatch repair protein MLH1